MRASNLTIFWAPFRCVPPAPLQEFNLTLGQSSGASVQPWVVGAIVGNMAGQGADFLVNKVRESAAAAHEPPA